MLFAALACASGCGGDCDDVGPPAGLSFTANLAIPQGGIPADIAIVLTGAGTNEAVGFDEINGDDPTSPCHADGDVRCSWGDGSPGKGTFDATATGFAPAHADLEATSASCNGVNPDHANVTLTAQ